MNFKFFFIVFISISQISCNSNLTQKKSAYDKEIQIPDGLKGKDSEGNEILLGEIDINQLKEFTKDWSNNYNPNSNILTKIKPLIKNKDIVLIMGTWCEDSEREIPGFINILESINYDTTKKLIESIKKGTKPKVGSTKNRKSDPENGATVLLSIKGKKNA